MYVHKYELDTVGIVCLCEQTSALVSQIVRSCWNLPSSCSLALPSVVIIFTLGMRQGFLRSGLCSGKTLWPAASVSHNSTDHAAAAAAAGRREDLQKDLGKSRKIKWIKGNKNKKPRQIKAENHLGGSCGREPLLLPRATFIFSLPLAYFLCVHLLLAEFQGFSPGVWVIE